MNKIIIVEDHPLMRAGITMTIESDPSMKVISQFSSGEEVLGQLDKMDVDVAIFDISLPGMNGLELVKHAVAIKPNLKILVVSRHEENLYAERAIRAGAKGYIMKLEAGDVIVKAIKRVLAGGIYVSDEISTKLLMGLATGKSLEQQTPLEVLSDRELEIFELMGHGNSTRDIAERLHISVKTVETYRARIKEKLNLASANELLQHAIQWVNRGTM